MSLKRILAAAICAAALALGISACGGGSSGSLDPAVGQRADIATAIAAADAAVGALDENAADEAIDAAVAALAAAKRAVEEADALSIAEESAFEASIRRIEEELGRARSAIAIAREERRRQMAAERMKLTAALASPARISAIGARVAHGAAPAMSGTVPGTPPAAVTDLETAPRGEASTVGGWSGRTYRAADNASGTIDTVVLWTDIEAPGSRPFSGEGGKYDATDGLAADGSLPIGAGTDAALIASPEFPTTAGIRTHMADTGGVVRVAGSFDGATGAYVCTPTGQSPCTSSVRHGGGVVLAGGGGWTFVPAPGATVAVPDGEYRYFGWWLRDTGAAHAVGVFHTGIGGAPDEFSGLAALQGPASYRGPAAGKFALFPPLGAAAAGTFTASVVLRAEFGDATDPGTMEGMVDGFMVDGERMPWSVTLGRSGIGADGALSAGGANTARTVWSIEGVAGSVPGTPPTWRGQLHDVNAQQVPSAATGAFEAAYGDIGRMVGAFGVTLQQQ
ncbi:MAG: hypothetical protein OYH76_21980 [Defluviicoccus sp.]|nr:hypothetical protein [Defluviicoccus sp.]MDE0278576.1 hypothetical protein [Defluviicoccus sp.]